MNPQKVFAGDSFKLRFKPPIFDESVTYELTLTSYAQSISISEESVEDGEIVYGVSSSLSINFAPGNYTWSIVARNTATDERTTLLAGVPLTIASDPTLPIEQSYARRMLSALQGLLEGRISATDAQYSSMSYEGRSITKLSPAELMRAIALFKRQVAEEEQNKNNNLGPRVVKAWFREQR